MAVMLNVSVNTSLIYWVFGHIRNIVWRVLQQTRGKNQLDQMNYNHITKLKSSLILQSWDWKPVKWSPIKYVFAKMSNPTAS